MIPVVGRVDTVGTATGSDPTMMIGGIGPIDGAPGLSGVAAAAAAAAAAVVVEAGAGVGAGAGGIVNK